jgi:hypothetical protein
LCKPDLCLLVLVGVENTRSYLSRRLLSYSPKSGDLHGNGTGHHYQYSCSSRILNSIWTSLRAAQAWEHVVTAQKEIRGHPSPVVNCNTTYTKLLFCVVCSSLSFLKYCTTSTSVASKLYTSVYRISFCIHTNTDIGLLIIKVADIEGFLLSAQCFVSFLRMM